MDPHWLQCHEKKSAARGRLFCFPHAGGGASAFRTWSLEMPPDLELCPVQLPGRESRLTEQLPSSLGLLIQKLTQGLRPYFDRPFALFGHSMGALLVFEFARALRRQRLVEPIHVFISGHRAPHLPDRHAPIHALARPALINRIRIFGGTPEEVWASEELRSLILPAIRADLHLCETYRYVPEAPLTCPLAAYCGRNDPYVDREELAAWRDHTSAEFSLRLLPGDHFYLRAERQRLVHDVVGRVKQALQRQSEVKA